MVRFAIEFESGDAGLAEVAAALSPGQDVPPDQLAPVLHAALERALAGPGDGSVRAVLVGDARGPFGSPGAVYSAPGYGGRSPVSPPVAPQADRPFRYERNERDDATPLAPRSLDEGDTP